MSIYTDVVTCEELFDEVYDHQTGEINEESLQALEELKNQILSEGLEKLCKVRANKMARIESLKNEEKRIADKRKAEETKLENLLQYIDLIMQKSGQDKAEAGSFNISYRKSTNVAVYDDFNDDRFIKVVEEKKVDKVALKKALSDGEQIDGAFLQINLNLQIK